MKVELEVKLEKFEGPMDLLYSLIVKNKIDIYDIPIAEITEQYLEYINYMNKYNMENLSEFLVMAANLIEIKSRMLLPKEVNEENEEIDPRDDLVKKIIEYKIFKGIALDFNKIQQESGFSYYREAEKDVVKKVKESVPKEISEILKDADANMLFDAFKEVLKRKEVKVEKIKKDFDPIKPDVFTVESKIKYLKSIIKKGEKISFFYFFEKDSSKNEIVTTFLAMLELIKENLIYIEQGENFSDIIITRA